MLWVLDQKPAEYPNYQMNGNIVPMKLGVFKSEHC